MRAVFLLLAAVLAATTGPTGWAGLRAAQAESKCFQAAGDHVGVALHSAPRTVELGRLLEGRKAHADAPVAFGLSGGATASLASSRVAARLRRGQPPDLAQRFDVEALPVVAQGPPAARDVA